MADCHSDGNTSDMSEFCYESSGIKNSKRREIKSELQDSQSRSDLNGKLIRDVNKKPEEWKSNLKKSNESQRMW